MHENLSTVELFPEIAQAAERKRKHLRSLDKTLHRLWLENNDPDQEKQTYLLRYITDRGPCALDIRFLQELQSLGLEGEEKMHAWSMFFFTAICLVSSGQLWRHDLYEDVAVFGVRHIQKKADYLAELHNGPQS